VRENVTVLIAQVQDLTGLTELLQPADFASLLRDYFRTMTEVIFEERGTLDRFAGDGVTAVFGAPVPFSDNAVRAVRCAWKIQKRLAALGERLPPAQRLTTRSGLQTGRVIAGNFGTPERFEFTALGQPVQMASRLRAMAEPGAVYVGRATFEQARTAFSFKELGTRPLHGRAGTVEVFQVVGEG